MSENFIRNRCPVCGGDISADDLQGMCPRCLLAVISEPIGAGATGSPPQAPEIEVVGKAFPELEIVELIGQGGMGFVYQARQPKLDRWVALKILPEKLAQDDAFRERFVREGQLLAALNHPNIVTVFDFGESGGFLFLMMEFVDGVNLRQAMKAGRFTPTEALAVVPSICEALEFAHSKGVLHRDIKPANILMDADGRVKLVDFGIAKLVGPKENTVLTASGHALGSPHYMAPEQFESPGEVDHRADIYSLGVVLYELLTGELPIGRFALPSEKTPVAAVVDDVVLRALAKEREHRQQSADEMKTEVVRVAGEGLLSAPEKNNQPLVKTSRRSVLVTAVGLVGLCIFMAVFADIFKERANRSEGSKPENDPEPVVPMETSKMMLFDRINADGWASLGYSSATPLDVGEFVRSTLRLEDGTIEEASWQWGLVRDYATIKHSHSGFWMLHRQHLGKEQVKEALRQFENMLTDRMLEMPFNQRVTVFMVTNSLNSRVYGELELVRRRSANTVPAVAHLQLYSVSDFGYKGLQMFYNHHTPIGYRIIPDSDAPPGVRSSIHFGDGNTLWMWPDAWTTNDIKTAIRQLNRWKGESSLRITTDSPAEAFAVTNENGKVLRGLFRLVGPGENQGLPVRVGQKDLSGPPTKTVEFGRLSDIGGAISITSPTPLSPTEALRFYLVFPDGRRENVVATYYQTSSRDGWKVGSECLWHLHGVAPEAESKVALEQFEGHLVDSKIDLPVNEAVAVFQITNEFGAEIRGEIELERVLPDKTGADAVAHVQAHSASESAGGGVMFSYYVDAPAGYRLRANREKSPGVHSSVDSDLKLQDLGIDGNVVWGWSKVFGKEERKEAIRQLDLLKGDRPLRVEYGKPSTAFAVTNLNGQVFRGTFELLGPDSKEP